MTFSDSIVEQARQHHTENVARLRAQAANRAKRNGRCPTEAAMLAEERWFPGASHEQIVSEVSGEFRRVA